MPRKKYKNNTKGKGIKEFVNNIGNKIKWGLSWVHNY